jgi:hypothetical protein
MAPNPVVIPAKAGIHLDLRLRLQSEMDSRLRGNDEAFFWRIRNPKTSGAPHE